MAHKKDHLKLVENNTRAPGWKRLLRFLLKLTVLAGFALLIWQGEAYFRVNEIRVEGAEVLQAEEILQAGGISRGMSIFLLGESKIADRIMKQLPRADHVVVKRELPHTVKIVVGEREPAAYVATADGFWLIDKKAVIMDYSDEANEDYPLILGVNGTRVIPGVPLECPVRVATLRSFFASWSKDNGLAIEQLDLQNSYNLIAYTVTGLEIWFGEGDDMDHKLRLVEESLPYIDPHTEARLDVRCGKRLVVSGSAVLKNEKREVKR